MNDKTRVGIHHEPALKSEYARGGEFPPRDTIRIECPEVPVLGMMLFELDKLPTDLKEFNRYMQRELAKAIAYGFDYGLMTGRSNQNSAFIDEGNERLFALLHSTDPVTHAEHVECSTKRWADDHERGSIDWVKMEEEKPGQVRAYVVGKETT